MGSLTVRKALFSIAFRFTSHLCRRVFMATFVVTMVADWSPCGFPLLNKLLIEGEKLRGVQKTKEKKRAEKLLKIRVNKI